MNNILSLVIFACFILFNNSVAGQKKILPNKIQYFYIVRHAEKEAGKDPGLMKSGHNRAGDLYRILKNKRIDEIYITQYRRAQMTADSLRVYENLKTIVYDADTSGHGLLYKMNEKNGFQKNLLIIGHSNTIPGIIRRLGITDFTLKEIPEDEYDNLYIIRQRKNKLSLAIRKFGQPSPKKNTSIPMQPLQ